MPVGKVSKNLKIRIKSAIWRFHSTLTKAKRHISKPDEIASELEKAKKRYADVDREHVWAFIAGQTSEDFRGNPKYLFVYINRYRADIKTYWLCNDDETIKQVRSLGFVAYKLNSPAAQYAIGHTGVLVTEQVKVVIPEGFENVKYLNLWHGVGIKHIERKLFSGDISMDLARKYVKYGTFYRDHQMMVVTSPTIEKEFSEDCGVDSDKFIRTGYLRCMYQQNFEPIRTFEHDLRKIKKLPSDTKLVVFAPTYRAKLGGTFNKAIKDFEKLYQCCERNNLLLIFKVHPNMEKEEGFLRALETYEKRARFWFWDNHNDFYEIMDQIDMAIIDYSAIFSDMVAAGIKHYIRYIFDYEDYMKDGLTQGDYFERTTGEVCYTFSELLKAIDTYPERNYSADLQKISDKLWSYAGGKEDFEKTIQHVMDFSIKSRKFPNLYSFDVFDTLISRKVLDPKGIFYAVKEHMEEHGGFPMALCHQYPNIRHAAEMNVREFYSKTAESRQSERVEIAFDEIFDRMADVYNLSKEQTNLLAQWELQEELDNVVPLKKNIELLKRILEAGETVILISDMYMSKSFLQKILLKADPILTEIPLFLSSEYGVLKTSQKLFFEVYKSFEPYYDFQKWIHFGDNQNADEIQPRKFKICSRKITTPCFNEIQKSMLMSLGNSDAYLVAAVQARMCFKATFWKDNFVISYISLSVVPYVDWVLRDAQRRGYKTLYFISRDGYHLKRIADAIINARKLSFKTKYIYASRRTWRIPSFINQVTDIFWSSLHGNFTNITSKQKLFKAMDLEEDTFRKFFPEINPDTIDFNDKKSFKSIVGIFKGSEQYNEYLLNVAAKERLIVENYLRQEIYFDEPFAVVEYYGSGYTQDAMIQLCEDIIGKKIKIPFYYSRSILPSIGNSLRHNFSTNTTGPYFMEAIFANMPYKSIEKYEIKDEKIVPVINPLNYDKELFASMKRILPEFAARYASLELKNPEDTGRLLHEFVFDYFQKNLTNKLFAENIGTLWDSIALYGKKREFAPPYTEGNIQQFANKELGRGDSTLTTNIAMSVTRSSDDIQKKYKDLYQILLGDALDSGRVLSEEELAINQKFRDKYEKLLIEADEYEKEYESAVRDNTIENKALFVVNGKTLNGSGLELVQNTLQEQSNLKLVTICMEKTNKSLQEITLELATAKYVIISRPVAQFCKIIFRDGTKEIMLNNVAFPLYNQDLAASYFLKWRNKYSQLAGANDIAVLQVPSEYLEERFRKNYSKCFGTECSLKGCCNTDIYFDENAGAKARDRLLKIFPEAAKKKVILYMPAVRARKACGQWMSIFDMDVLQRLIGKEYVVVLNFNTNQFNNSFRNIFEVPGFSMMINKGIPLRQLMLAADIIVGDYRDTFFESALMRKPVYFTAGDYEEIIKSKNMDVSNEFEKYIFGPVVITAHDLAGQLKQIDTYDYKPMERFCNDILTNCDGHSVRRVVEYLISSSENIEDGVN